MQIEIENCVKNTVKRAKSLNKAKLKMKMFEAYKASENKST